MMNSEKQRALEGVRHLLQQAQREANKGLSTLAYAAEDVPLEKLGDYLAKYSDEVLQNFANAKLKLQSAVVLELAYQEVA